jgi:hypothetical protein
MEDILLLTLCSTKVIYVFALDKCMLLVYQINEQPKLTIAFITWSTFPVHVQKSIDVSILPMITQTIVVSNAISIFHIGSQCYTYHVDDNDNDNVDGSCTFDN